MPFGDNLTKYTMFTRLIIILSLILYGFQLNAQTFRTETIPAVDPPINIWKDGIPNNAKPSYFMTSDLAFFELRGHVRECTDPDTGTKLVFDIDGNLTSSSITLNPKRDTRGRIVREGSDEPCEMDGEIYYSTISWRDDYTMLRRNSPNPEGDIDIRYIYGENINGTKVRNIIRKELTATGPNYGGTVKYEYVSFDSQNNWTCRWVKNNLTCKWDGSRLNNTEIEHRQIIYWEQSPLEEGRLYLFNRPDMPQNYQKALDLFNKAANEGNSDALWEIGNMYRKGLGVKRSLFQAEEYFEESARKGNPIGKYWLAVMHEKEEVVIKDEALEKAYDLYRESYLQLKKIDEEGKGDSYTWHYLGMINLYGNGLIEKPKFNGKETTEERASALINFYSTTHPTKALEYFKKSASLGNANSQYALGQMYSVPNSKIYNLDTAERWLRSAVAQGLPDAYSSLGNIMLYKGETDSAVSLFYTGDIMGDSYSTYNMGLCYKSGWGVNKSPDKAKEYFIKAAKNKHKQAIDTLVKMGIQLEETE